MNKIDALIIGAGPAGLFTAHQLKLIGLNCEIVDNLDKIGGQCIELYPDKPIYDIPAVPECTGEELTNNLLNQLKPFDIKFYLSERVEEVKKEKNNWLVKTNKGTTFSTPNVIIAGGVGSFEPRKFSPKECEKFEDKSLFYSIKDKKIFKGKIVSIFGGGDSALDWAVELSKDCKVNLIHRRDEFRGAKATLNTVHELAKVGKINLFTKYQMTSVKGNGQLESIDIKNDEDEIKNIKVFTPEIITDYTTKLNKIRAGLPTLKYPTSQDMSPHEKLATLSAQKKHHRINVLVIELIIYILSSVSRPEFKTAKRKIDELSSAIEQALQNKKAKTQAEKTVASNTSDHQLTPAVSEQTSGSSGNTVSGS